MDPFACVLHHLHPLDSSDSLLVQHLLTSWWIARWLNRFLSTYLHTYKYFSVCYILWYHFTSGASNVISNDTDFDTSLLFCECWFFWPKREKHFISIKRISRWLTLSYSCNQCECGKMIGKFNFTKEKTLHCLSPTKCFQLTKSSFWP